MPCDVYFLVLIMWLRPRVVGVAVVCLEPCIHRLSMSLYLYIVISYVLEAGICLDFPNVMAHRSPVMHVCGNA